MKLIAGGLLTNMMLITRLTCITMLMITTIAVEFPNNPTSAMSAEKGFFKSNKTDTSDESGHEIETEIEDKKFLDEALKTVLDPTIVIAKTDDVVETFKIQLTELDKENSTLELFMEEMDNLSLEICKTSQEALWDYVTDINSEGKKNKMVRIAAEEDEIKKQYWTILKKKYFSDQDPILDLKLKRKIRIIKERGTNVQMPQSKQREEIDTMQRIWSRVSVCAYNSTVCNNEDALRTMNDIITIFKNGNDTEELAYYWKAYRDATGRKIRPIFKDYVLRMNNVAISENFTDAGDMWRYAFEDDFFLETVKRLWTEIKPFYFLLHGYVRAKLKSYYKEELQHDSKLIPAHILGNLWAQEWQAIYNKVAAYPSVERASVLSNESIRSKDLFNAVDEYHQSLGFESASDTFQDIKETMTTVNCLPSSHDMCDGVNYKIKWCGEKVSDVTVGLSRAARLLGHVQYFKHYRNLQPLYRDGPNPGTMYSQIEHQKITKQLEALLPKDYFKLQMEHWLRKEARNITAFHDAISDIVAVQLTSPKHLKTLSFVKVDATVESTLNHLLWLALEKFPLMAYAYALDKWRWDIFSNSSIEGWNQHWWDLRIHETGVSPPVPRNESDLDPAAKYHVVSHVQYITYLISHILEFQILLSLCKRANHTGPLHECSIYGVKEAGKLLSDGMTLGASEDWRTVLYTMTGETELSTKGILEYFGVLEEFLKAETAKLENDKQIDTNAPIVVGIIVVILTLLMFILYCVKKPDSASKILSFCGLSKNGSLDIAANELSQTKSNEVEGVSEEKV